MEIQKTREFSYSSVPNVGQTKKTHVFENRPRKLLYLKTDQENQCLCACSVSVANGSDTVIVVNGQHSFSVMSPSSPDLIV